MFRLLPILYIVVPFLKLVWRLLRDRRVPLFTKIIPVIAFLYLAWPTDVIKDFIPILGHLDDLIIVSLLLLLFIAASPGQVVADQTIGKKLRDLQRQYGQDEKKEPSQAKTVEAEIRYVEEDDDDENREQK
ncbi:MAG: DUF1232 domain-containing protein [SAR202 cluster bacterium]|jgi:uncharacterized membrane protein YkvA (DUF1232 family)|nr:MAG: DUF1232 domain-containing protein [SAR202 cluster bacterium]|tara:strand:- start:219 stop:611 length:393 start_codon:yes stop_codon:yes gene_type:complete